MKRADTAGAVDWLADCGGCSMARCSVPELQRETAIITTFRKLLEAAMVNWALTEVNVVTGDTVVLGMTQLRLVLEVGHLVVKGVQGARGGNPVDEVGVPDVELLLLVSPPTTQQTLPPMAATPPPVHFVTLVRRVRRLQTQTPHRLPLLSLQTHQNRHHQGNDQPARLG